jgi:hypothetical protein
VSGRLRATPARGWRSGWQCSRLAAVAHRNSSYTTLCDSIFDEAPEAVGLGRAARNRCGGERGEARVPWLENHRIPRLGSSIYRGF